MAEIIRMPKMSDTMEEGVIANWNVKVGDKVIFNEYDMKGLQDDDEYMYALTKESSIMATYE
jgi:co-chaperonin GroES (HSP10)